MSKHDDKKNAPTEGGASAAEDLRTPQRWAEELGHVIKADARLPQSSDRRTTEYAVAAQLHGWDQDAHHNQGDKAFRLSEADFLAALRLAPLFPTVPPHEAALPMSMRGRFKVFKPRKATKEGVERVKAAQAALEQDITAASERAKQRVDAAARKVANDDSKEAS